MSKSLGKKRLVECKLKMTRIDKYTLKCPAGHIKRTTEWEHRSFEAFIEGAEIEREY